MNNKTFIIIGLILCLLFTIPMVSAAEVSADSDLIDNSVIGSNINSQAILTSDANALENNIDDIVSNDNNIDSDANTNDGENNGVGDVTEIDIDDSIDEDEADIINSGNNNKNSNDKNILGANALGADGTGNTFSDLKILIDNAIAGGATSLTLDRDFTFTTGEDDSLTGGIPISSPITIFGGSHTIDGSNLARIFDIKSNKVFLNNIVFKNANASSTDSLGANGGAIYVEAEGTSTDYCGINNSTFINCYSLKDGGALYIRGDYFTLSNSTFINNTAGDDGGAIDWEGDYGKIYNINASGNSAISYGTSNSKGGAMILTGSNMAIDRVNISNSRTKAEGSGTDHDEIQGGAIFLTGNNVNITNSSFTNCSVEYDGDNASAGALYVIGDDVNIINCNFTNNSATEYGGALYVSGDNVALNNTVFIGNVAHNDGGAIQWDGDNGKISNLIADNNYADSAHGTSKGGTIIIRGSNAVIDKAQISNSYVDSVDDTRKPQGGAIAISGSGCNISNSSFTNCSVKNGGDDASGGALYIWGNKTNVISCNFTNNSAIEDGGAIFIEGDDCTLNSTVFIGNVAHNDGGAIEWNGDNGKIYDMTADSNYADSTHGSSKGGTLIVTGSNMDIDKMNITNSHVEGDSSARNVQGGAIFLTGNNTNINNSVFEACYVDYQGENASGGAIYILGNFSKIENCNFTENIAHQDGGAIYISGSDVSVVDSYFTENFASKSGGAIFLIDNKNSQINGSHFITNVALVNGGAIDFYAGAEDGLVSSCEFVDNSAWGAGGSVYWEGTRGIVEYSNFTGSRATGAASSQNSGRGGSVIWLGDRGEMRECIFNDSVSKKEGSALYIIGNDFAAYASNVTNSKSEESSGTIYIQGTYAKIGDCYMDNNTVKEKGGGIFVKGNFVSISGTTINNSSSGNAGSAVYVEGNRTEIKNSLVSNNNANTSGAVYIAGSRSTVTNVNFENNTAKTSAGAIYISGDDTIVTLSNFTNNTAYKGGAILYEGQRITISYSNFTLNRANGTTDAKGGSISIKGKSGDSIIGCTFKDSSSGSSGGSIHWLAGGEGGLIQNCTFINSSTDGLNIQGQGHGGAIIWEGNLNGVVDNCTFIDCVAKGTKNAGAIYMGTSSSSATNPVITNCVIVNCSNGERGVINIYGINATLENITFANMSKVATSNRGFHAIEFEKLTTGRVINCTFENITGSYEAGAIKVDSGSDIVIANNTFFNVSSTTNGGAVYTTSVSGYQIIENNTFINCSSVNNGGALYANNKVTSFKNNTFINNTLSSESGKGGAVYLAASGQAIDNSTFINNSGANQGGAVFSTNALTVNNSYFESNSADSGTTNIRGGAVYVNAGGMTVNNSTFIANSALIDGGALYAGSNGLIKISNSTFEHNTAGNSGGVLFTGGSAYVNGSSTLMYNNATSGSAIKANSVYINDTVLLENQAHFREWADRSHTMSDTHATISGTFRGEDNLLNAINANNYAFKNVVYCGINGETTNTDDVTSAKSNNEVYQLIVLEIYNAENELVGTIEQYTDANGHYAFDFDLEDASNHAYKVIHPEDNYYTGAEYTIGKALSNLTISSQNITHPEDENITFTVTGAGDAPTGNITVFINDTNGTVIYNDTILLNASSQASITLPRLNSTEYYISAKYNGDDNYLPDKETDVFHVNMGSSFINIGIENYTYNGTRNITITIPYIEEGKVSVIVSNDEYSQLYTVYVTEGTEQLEIELPILDAGEYKIDAVFHGNNNYFPSENTTNFTVFKAASIIDIAVENVTGGESAEVEIHVSPEIATQNVNVTVRDKDGNIVAEYEELGLLNSKTNITLPLLSRGEYNITVSYGGDKNHNESSNSTLFSVTKDLFPITIEAINLTYGEDQVIVITVPADADEYELWINMNQSFVAVGYDIDENGKIYIDVAQALAEILQVDNYTIPVGNFTIYVHYDGDDNYLENTTNFTFEIFKADVDMTVTPQNITYGEIENITIEIPKLNEIGQNDALTLYVNSTNNESIKYVIENYNIGTDGKAIWNIDGNILPAGEYIVEAVYVGSDNYNPINGTASFTVSKANPWIEIEVNNIFVGEDEVINITVHPNGENGVTGNVTLYVRDKEVNLTLDENGKATYTLSDEVEGTGITVIAIYNGDNNYNDARNSTHYNVTKQNTTTVVDALSPIKYGTVEDLNVTVNFTDATGTITLYINSTVDGFNNITKVFTITETDEGKVNWNIDELVLPVGTYDVTAIYSGDRKYNNSTSQITLIVVEQNEEYEITVEANNTVYGDDEIIIVTVPDDADGTVTISIDGREIETKQVSGGKAVFNLTGLEVHDDYNVTATYNGDANYKAGNSASDLFNVSKAQSHVNVSAEDIDFGQIENITVGIPDNNASGKVNITIYNKSDSTQVIRTLNDVSIDATEEIVKAFEGLVAGNYTVKVEYYDDHNYGPSEDTADFEVRKIDPTLSENSPDIIYGENENITVSISGVEGGLSPTGTIEVQVDGVTVDTITIGDDLEYIVLKPAVDPRHNVTVIYSGDSNYNPITITGEFAVSQNDTYELEEDSPNIVYGNNETITITLPNDATGTVYLVVNGTYYTPIGIDENHQAVFNITYPIVGEYTFTAYYSGDNNYVAKDINGEFNVTKADVSLSETHAPTITYGENNTIAVTITGVEGPEGVLAPTGTIKVLVDGDEIGNITIGEELVFTSIKPFADSQHNITVIYSGDNNYNDKTITGEFEVIQNSTVLITEDSPDISYGENETITVTIAGDATGTITVTVGDEQIGDIVTITEITENDKVFTFNITKPDGGVYDDLKVTYSGDDNYAAKTLEGEFTVSPIEPEITEDSPDIVYTNNETIAITVPQGATGTLTVTVKNSKGEAIVDAKVLSIGSDDLTVTIEKPIVDNYTITIDYSGCTNYTAKTIEGEFEVTKASNEITVVPTNITYGQSETITVTVPDGATGSVSITVGDYTDTQEISEGATEVVFNIPKETGDELLNANENYVVFANYSGDGNYESATANAPFHVDPANTTLSIEVDNIHYGEDEIINITVNGVEGAAVPDGFVTITINGTDIELTKRVDSEGKVSFNVTGLVAGDYNVTAIYESNTVNYNDSNNSALFSVGKADVKDENKNITAINITYGEDETITVILNETNITGNVTITIGDYTDTQPLDNGKVVFTVPHLEANEYTVVANYSGDDNYNPISIQDGLSTDFKVDKANVTVLVNPVDIIYKETEEINVTVTGVVIDEEATGVAKYNLTGKVTIYIDDVESQTLDITQADENGILHFSVDGLAVGKHNVTAVYHDDRNYNDNNDTKDFNVANALPENMIVNTTNITYHIESENITVDLGEVLNGTLAVYLNGTEIYNAEVRDKDKIVLDPIENLEVGNYTVRAVFSANDDSVDASSTFEVRKAPTVVTVEPIDITYGEIENITVFVDNTISDKFNLTGSVTIYINGREVETKAIGSDGKVTFNVEGLEASDDYVVEAKYHDDSNYMDESSTSPFKVSKADVSDFNETTDNNITAVNITYGEDETITLEFSENNITGKVTITINGTEIETKDLENGKVVFTVKDLEVNEYTVVANYSGDTNYNAKEGITANFTVSKANSTVTVDPTPSIVYGDNETITVTVPIRNHTGTITLTINGTDYEFIKHLTAEDGDEIVLTNVSGLAVGTYNVTVKYDNDRNYNDSEASALFEVTKATPSDMTVSPQNITYTEDEIITVTVGDANATGSVTITIGDYTDTSELDENGQAKFNVTGLVVGHYTVVANYSGDANYTSLEVSAPFQVDKAASNVTVEVENIIYGETEYANITIPNYNASGRVIIKVDGKSYDILPIDNDTPVKLELDGLAVGTHSIDVEYFDDDNYNKSLAHVEFNVTKAIIPVDPENESSLIVVPTNITYLDNETIVVSVGVNNATGRVTIKINGTDVELTKNITEEGSQSVTFTVPNLAVGEYNVTVAYSDDANYEDAETSALFTVSPADSLVSVEAVNITYLDDETITVTIPITNASGTVVVKINGTEVNSTKFDGEDNPSIEIIVPGLAVGEYNVTVEYRDDVNYNDSDASTLFHVDKANVPDVPDTEGLVVIPSNITYLDDESITVSIDVPNATGKVTININGTDVETKDIGEDGTVTFTVPNLAVGEYNVTAKYHDDPNYNDYDVSALFHVDPAESSVTVVPVNITYNEDETISVTVPITNASGKVTITINGTDVELTESVDENGKATFTVSGLVVGEYNVTAKYHDDPNYNDSESSALFTVSKANVTDITVAPTNITYGENETITITIGDNNATGNITITVNGTEYGPQELVDGSTVFNVSGLVAGDYKVDVSYSGDDNYNATTANADFTVDKAKPNVYAVGTNITYGSDEQITAIVDGKNITGNVTIFIDGNEIDTVDLTQTETGGRVVFNVPGLSAGNHTVKVVYNGDDNHYSSEGEDNFTVSKAKPPMEINTTDVDFHETENITVTLPEDATGTVNVTVTDKDGNNKTFTDVPVGEDGKVTIPVEDLKAGDYNVTVQYSGDENYTAANGTSRFRVNKIDADVEVNATDITYGENETIKYGVNEDATGTVNITVVGDNGVTKIFTDVPVENGTVGINVEDLPAGNYNVTVQYSGDDNYNPATGKDSFTVAKADTPMDINATDIDYNQTENITITLPEDATGTVNVTVTDKDGNNKTFTDVPVGEDGKVTIPVDDLGAGDYDVKVSYSGDDNYNPVNGTSSFTVNKIDPDLDVNTTDITYGENETITVTLPNDATGTVNVTVTGDNGVTKTFTDVPVGEDGTVTIPVENLTAGNYDVEINYSGDNNYNDRNATGSFTVDKAKPTMEVNATNIDHGEIENVTVGLAGVEGGAVPTGTVNVTVTGDNGVTKTFTDVPINEDGTVKVPVESLPVGNYNVTVNYSGDENYTAINGTAKFGVGLIDPDLEVNTSDITYGEDDNIKITLNGAEGGLTPTGTVTVTVTDKDGNNKTYPDVPVGEDGTVTITVEDLAAGDYDVKVDYSGDNNYNPATAKADFTVNKAEPKLEIDTEDIDFHENEEITVTVTGVEGHTPTGDVTITVTDKDGNNKTYTKPINPDGTVTISIDDLAAGDYDVKVEYPGDENYTAVNGTDKFTVNKINTPVEVDTNDITYGDDETITVTVPDDATGTVNITVTDKDGNSQTFTDVPINDGSAEITVPELNAGDYTVHVDYSGDNNYIPNSTDGKFEVAKANATVEIHVYDIVYGDIEYLTVTCNAPGTVTIYVNGAEVTLPLENGHAHIIFASALGAYSGKAAWDLENLAVGTYPASVHYNGNENYNEADDDDVFNVIKENTTTKVSVDDIKVGEDAVINVEVSHEQGTEKINANITVTVDGKEYTVELVDGKGKLTVPGLKAGEHTVKAEYPGSHNYTESSDTTTFKATKNSPKVSVDSNDIKVGDDETITVTVPDDATGTVTITVDGKSYTAPVKDGKAVFTVPGLKAGEHTVKAKYSGDDKYLPGEASDKFTVSKVKPDIETSSPTVTEGEDGTVTVTVPEDATGTVTIEVNGKNYTAKIKDGKAVFTIPGLKPGKYPIKVYYSGDDKYQATTADGGVLEVVAKQHNGTDNQKVHGNGAGRVDLSTYETGNPIAVLLILFALLGFMPLRRKKDDEEDE